MVWLRNRVQCYGCAGMCEQPPGHAQSRKEEQRKLLNHMTGPIQQIIKERCLEVVPTTDHMDTEKLKSREQIKFFEEVLRIEDELHDHGVSSLSVKIRVMPSSFSRPLRFFLRIDGVLIRMNDARLSHEADKTYML